jgi:hypothetical protein
VSEQEVAAHAEAIAWVAAPAAEGKRSPPKGSNQADAFSYHEQLHLTRPQLMFWWWRKPPFGGSCRAAAAAGLRSGHDAHRQQPARQCAGQHAYARSPRMRRASWMSLGMMVTRLAWMAHRLVSSNRPTR